MPERDGYIPECPAGWTPASPTRRQRVTSTAAFSAGSSRTCYRRSRAASTSSRACVVATSPRSGRSPRPPVGGDVEHICLGRQRRRDRCEGPRSGRKRRDGAVRRHGFRAHGCLHRSRGSDVLCLAGEGAVGATIVNEHGSLNFNGLNTRDIEGAKSFYGSVFGWTTWPFPARRCGRCRATATTSRASTRASASRWRRSAAPRASRTSSPASIRSRTTSPTSAALERDLRGGRCRRHGSEGDRARRQRGRSALRRLWVRMTVINDLQGATFIASSWPNKDLGREAEPRPAPPSPTSEMPGARFARVPPNSGHGRIRGGDRRRRRARSAGVQSRSRDLPQDQAHGRGHQARRRQVLPRRWRRDHARGRAAADDARALARKACTGDRRLDA